MGILKPIAPDGLSVINVVMTMIWQNVSKIPLPNRSAPFVVGPIQLIIKVAMSTAVSR